MMCWRLKWDFPWHSVINLTTTVVVPAEVCLSRFDLASEQVKSWQEIWVTVTKIKPKFNKNQNYLTLWGWIVDWFDCQWWCPGCRSGCPAGCSLGWRSTHGPSRPPPPAMLAAPPSLQWSVSRSSPAARQRLKPSTRGPAPPLVNPCCQVRAVWISWQWPSNWQLPTRQQWMILERWLAHICILSLWKCNLFQFSNFSFNSDFSRIFHISTYNVGQRRLHFTYLTEIDWKENWE